MINIIDHISVPKHILLTEEELKSVIDSYHAKRREIPEILGTITTLLKLNNKEVLWA